MHKHTHLWNDMPQDERARLMPYQIECQIRHIEQCKRIATRNHKRHMADLNDWLKNLKRSLKEEEGQQ